MVVIEENKGYAATLGNCSADPYYCSLAATYASLTNWFGVTHPSLPNYYALVSGSTQGCTSDTCGAFGAPSIGSQLNAAGVPWTAYMESMPSACDKSPSGGYVVRHDPFVYSLAITNCAQHVVPYPGVTAMVSALNSGAAGDFVWITPNLTNDMHDGTVQQGDAWLKANLAPVLTSSWFTNFNSTVIVTMDEGYGGGTNQIPMVVMSDSAKGRGAIATIGNHYGDLRAIEEAFGLSLLGGATSGTDLSWLFG
jgi:phosphatidylinositol-3-phosphatase